MMNGQGKSDRPEVPAKFPNKDGSRKPPGYGGSYTGTKAETPDTAKGRSTGRAAEADLTAEGMEGRGLAKGNLRQQNAPRTPSRTGAPNALERVRQAASRDKEMRFTALLHHVYNLETMRAAYFSLKKDAAPGVGRGNMAALRQGVWRSTSGTCRKGCSEACTGPSRCVGCTYRRPTGGKGRSE